VDSSKEIKLETEGNLARPVSSDFSVSLHLQRYRCSFPLDKGRAPLTLGSYGLLQGTVSESSPGLMTCLRGEGRRQGESESDLVAFAIFLNSFSLKYPICFGVARSEPRHGQVGRKGVYGQRCLS
jgi:hypothetical protein